MLKKGMGKSILMTVLITGNVIWASWQNAQITMIIFLSR